MTKSIDFYSLSKYVIDEFRKNNRDELSRKFFKLNIDTVKLIIFRDCFFNPF